MNNKIVVLVVAVTSMLTFGYVADVVNRDNSMMIKVNSHNGKLIYYYDRDTKVMYVTTNDGGITPLLNSNGTPKLFNEYDVSSWD